MTRFMFVVQPDNIHVFSSWGEVLEQLVATGGLHMMRLPHSAMIQLQSSRRCCPKTCQKKKPKSTITGTMAQTNKPHFDLHASRKNALSTPQKRTSTRIKSPTRKHSPPLWAPRILLEKTFRVVLLSKRPLRVSSRQQRSHSQPLRAHGILLERTFQVLLRKNLKRGYTEYSKSIDFVYLDDSDFIYTSHLKLLSNSIDFVHSACGMTAFT